MAYTQQWQESDQIFVRLQDFTHLRDASARLALILFPHHQRQCLSLQPSPRRLISQTSLNITAPAKNALAGNLRPKARTSSTRTDQLSQITVEDPVPARLN